MLVPYIDSGTIVLLSIENTRWGMQTGVILKGENQHTWARRLTFGHGDPSLTQLQEVDETIEAEAGTHTPRGAAFSGG